MPLPRTPSDHQGCGLRHGPPSFTSGSDKVDCWISPQVYYAGRRATLHARSLTLTLSWIKVFTNSSHYICLYFALFYPPRTQGLMPSLLLLCVGVVNFCPSGLIVGSCLSPSKEEADGTGCMCGGCVGSEGFNLFGDIGGTSVGTWCTQVRTSNFL